MGLYHDQAQILLNIYNSSEPLGGDLICQRMGIGLKTLKKEIDIINDNCSKYGGVIRSKMGEGYYLDIEDAEAFDIFIDDIKRKFYSNLFFRGGQSERMHLILRQFLSGASLSIDDLAELCLCSESTVNRDMKLVRKRLGEYHLSLVKDKKYGLKIEGSEWHIRLALITEYVFYNGFETVQHFGVETNINEMFLHKGIYADMLIDRMHLAFSLCDYHVPYYTYDNMANMIILTLTRKKYSNALDQDLEWFLKADVEKEKVVIAKIFENMPVLSGFELSEAELLALSIFLKSHRVIKYRDFLELEGHEEMEELVDGFIAYMEGIYDTNHLDTGILRKDLCCELTRLNWKEDYEIITLRQRINNFTRDGLLGLDFCTLLYLYLKEQKGQDPLGNNIALFYYIFTQFNRHCMLNNKVRILVVSRLGFYSARSLAGNIRTKVNRPQIEFQPIEYYELDNINMSEVDGIMTDIDSMKEEYYYKPVYFIRYFRNQSEIDQLTKEVLNRKYGVEKLFTPEDIYYMEDPKDYAEVEEFIFANVLSEKDDKKKYKEELDRSEALFKHSRENMLVIWNTLGDYLHRDMIKVVLLRNAVPYGDNYINKIVIYNVKDAELSRLSYLTQRIARIIHHGELIPIRNREEDYEALSRLMFE